MSYNIENVQNIKSIDESHINDMQYNNFGNLLVTCS